MELISGIIATVLFIVCLSRGLPKQVTAKIKFLRNRWLHLLCAIGMVATVLVHWSLSWFTLTFSTGLALVVLVIADIVLGLCMRKVSRKRQILSVHIIMGIAIALVLLAHIVVHVVLPQLG